MSATAKSRTDKAKASTRNANRSGSSRDLSRPGREALPRVNNPRGGTMLAIRSQLRFSRELFARLLPVSVRSLAMIEAGGRPGDPTVRRLTELSRLIDALGEVMQPDFVGDWLQAPNDAFSGFKPLEIIERGETDRIWQMIHHLHSGSPS